MFRFGEIVHSGWAFTWSGRLRQTFAIFAFDLALAATSYGASVYLRLGDEASSVLASSLLFPWIIFVAICGVVFWTTKVPLGIWRYTSLKDMIGIVRAVSLVCLVYILIAFLLTRGEDLPRTTLVINWFVLVALMSAPRICSRIKADGGIKRNLFRRTTTRENAYGSGIPIILIGTDDAAEAFLRNLERLAHPPYRVLGLVADDKKDASNKFGLHIQGKPVLGHLDNLEKILKSISVNGDKPKKLILTRPTNGNRLQRLIEIATAQEMRIGKLPPLIDLTLEEDEGNGIRRMAVEDLLGRTPATLKKDSLLQRLNNQRVLVTGAGGSIGSELVRQLATMSPQHICLVDASEALLYTIDSQIDDAFPFLSKKAIVANVRDEGRIRQVLREERPTLVFHAAAMKHVPLVESNKIEGVLTNIIGTRNVANACLEAGVDSMVLISTDKAVNPESIMGSTKRVAEEYCRSLNSVKCNFINSPIPLSNNTENLGSTYFNVVRFGNVLGSSGSVVPLFERQISSGGPITITHPDMCRYFMTVGEAVELVLHAAAMGLDANARVGGSIFVLDMGKPVRILDLAEHMVRLAGLKPHVDIEIKITGIRPGEKLNEELFDEKEALAPTSHPALFRAFAEETNPEELAGRLDCLELSCKEGLEERVVILLEDLVKGEQIYDRSQVEPDLVEVGS